MAEQSARDLSYREVGATRGDLPAGYVHDRESADLGSFDGGTFDRAAAALRAWRIQAGAGLSVYPGDLVTDGATFALVMRMPVAGYIAAAGRVVFVIEEPDRRGFGYGTLPGHPEQGEEAFVIVRRGDRMFFEITAFSRPRHPLARFAKPVSRMLQRHTTRRYIAAMRAELR
ncbi:MAG TPA: DUF1990 domain-containing protein [Streptosporangiaceae bacterium]